jgi:hypothetical protein
MHLRAISSFVHHDAATHSRTHERNLVVKLRKFPDGGVTPASSVYCTVCTDFNIVVNDYAKWLGLFHDRGFQVRNRNKAEPILIPAIKNFSTTG